MKIKSFLISGILGLVCIFNFSNAESYNGMSFSCSVGGEIDGYNQCDDDYLVFDNPIEGEYIFSVSSSLEGFSTTISVMNGSFDNVPGQGATVMTYYYPGNHNLYCAEGGCNSLNMYGYGNFEGNTPALITYTVSPVGGTGGEGGEGGEGGGIITNGINAFGGIVDKLGNITTEFVPYLIYIFIGILGISLTINVVKYILGYLKGGAENSIGGREGVRHSSKYYGMKARRTWRRRNRRFGKYLKKNYKYNTPKFGSFGYKSRRE